MTKKENNKKFSHQKMRKMSRNSTLNCAGNVYELVCALNEKHIKDNNKAFLQIRFIFLRGNI